MFSISFLVGSIISNDCNVCVIGVYYGVYIFRLDIGELCVGVICGIGKIWYDKVKCNVDFVNMLECFDGVKFYISDDYFKDIIIWCKGIELMIINYRL